MDGAGTNVINARSFGGATFENVDARNVGQRFDNNCGSFNFPPTGPEFKITQAGGNDGGWSDWGRGATTARRRWSRPSRRRGSSRRGRRAPARRRRRRAAAGVSPSTVSNVYNRPDVVSRQLRERVLRAAAELGYGGADPAARSLRSGRTGAVGRRPARAPRVHLRRPAAVRFLQGVSDAADPEQLALVIVPAYPERAAYSTAIGRAAVDGLLLYSLVADDPLLAPRSSAACPPW